MGFALSNIQLSSMAFSQDGAIPARYTGEGEDVSPDLSWSNGSEGTESFAIICHDPDAPLVSAVGTYGFVHWVYYNIPASVTSLGTGCRKYTNGKTDFGQEAYGGPMPPAGHGRHNYYFWVLALNESLNLEGGLTLAEFLARAEPNITGMNRLVGHYKRG
jgi:Raf kinase inhibitor-like YbhB/YbcL family protein